MRKITRVTVEIEDEGSTEPTHRSRGQQSMQLDCDLPEDSRMLQLAKTYKALADQLVDWESENGSAKPPSAENTPSIWQIHSLVAKHRQELDENTRAELRAAMSAVAVAAGAPNGFQFTECEVVALETLMLEGWAKPLAPYAQAPASASVPNILFW